MRTLRYCISGLVLLGLAVSLAAQTEGKLKTAKIDWVADGPMLVYDVHFTGADTMPTALKTLLKDIAESEGFYLTGKDKSTTVSSTSKRISIEYVASKSKLKPARIGKIDIKETPISVDCMVAFAKKPAEADLTKVDEILETFARKYRKTAKGIASAVKHSEGSLPVVWTFEVKFNDPSKVKK